MKRNEIRAVLRRAFHEAHVNVEGLIDAYGRMPQDDPVVVEARDFLARMDAVSMHLLGEPVQTLTGRYDSGKRYRVLPDGSLEPMMEQPK